MPLITPDQTKCTREQYLAYLRQVVTFNDLDIRTYEPLVGFEHAPDATFTLTTRSRAGERCTRAKRVVLCVGGTDCPRTLGIPGEDLPHVAAYFNEPHAYFRQKLLVIGGRNSAVEAALRCHHAGAKVALSYRQEKLPEASIKYWLMPEIAGYLKTEDIRLHALTTPVKITPTHVTLRKCGPEHCVGGTFDVAADFVLKLIGYEQDNRLLKLCGVDLTGPQQAPVYDKQTMQTNVPNLYIAGTAIGGTQDRYRVFLENCHVHVDRILAHLTGETIRRVERTFEREES